MELVSGKGGENKFKDSYAKMDDGDSRNADKCKLALIALLDRTNRYAMF